MQSCLSQGLFDVKLFTHKNVFASLRSDVKMSVSLGLVMNFTLILSRVMQGIITPLQPRVGAIVLSQVVQLWMSYAGLSASWQ